MFSHARTLIALIWTCGLLAMPGCGDEQADVRSAVELADDGQAAGEQATAAKRAAFEEQAAAEQAAAEQAAAEEEFEDLLEAEEIVQARNMLREKPLADRDAEDLLEFWDQIGFAFKNRGDAANAEEAFLQMTLLDDSSAAGWNSLGLLVREDDPRKAVDYYEKAAEREEMPMLKADILTSLGVVQWEVGFMTNAERSFGEAVELAPEDFIAKSALGMLLADQGIRNSNRDKMKRAVALLEEVGNDELAMSAAGPNVVSNWFLKLGMARYSLGDRAEARSALLVSERLGNPDASYVLRQYDSR